MDENKPRRRWLSFGIRDLLWAMLVVGLVVGWWCEYRYDRHRAAIIEQGATIFSRSGLGSASHQQLTLGFHDGTVVEVDLTSND